MIEQRSYDWAYDMGLEVRRIYGVKTGVMQLNPFAIHNDWWKAWRDGFYQIQRGQVTA